MVARNNWGNIDALRDTDEVKFVIRDRHDYEWAKDVITKHALTTRCPVLFSPVFGALENVDLASWIVDDGIDVRFQIQVHKYIWDPKARGV